MRFEHFGTVLVMALSCWWASPGRATSAVVGSEGDHGARPFFQKINCGSVEAGCENLKYKACFKSELLSNTALCFDSQHSTPCSTGSTICSASRDADKTDDHNACKLTSTPGPTPTLE